MSGTEQFEKCSQHITRNSQNEGVFLRKFGDLARMFDGVVVTLFEELQLFRVKEFLRDRKHLKKIRNALFFMHRYYH